MCIRRDLKQKEQIAKLETMLFLTDKKIQNEITTLTFFVYRVNQNLLKIHEVSSIMVLGQLDNHIQKNEVIPLPHIT